VTHPAILLPKRFNRIFCSFEHCSALRRFASAAHSKLVVGMFALLCLAPAALAGSKYGVIYRFPNETHGYWPRAVITDASGNIYGVTQLGGQFNEGVVYLLSPPTTKGQPWTRTVLHNFLRGTGGQLCSLVLDQAGNLYGTAYLEGTYGVVFELSPPGTPGGAWKETNIHTFASWDGWGPTGLVIDQSGTLYGTTYGGGRDCSGSGCGTVYKLTPPSSHQQEWKLTTLYFFKGVLGNGNGDGAEPLGLTLDSNGNLYGTTQGGGACTPEDGCGGTAFELKEAAKRQNGWVESVLYRFAPGSGELLSGVVLDKSGALYGATISSVYQLALQHGAWAVNTLTSGSYCYYNGLAINSSGSLYGTTVNCGKSDDGMLFKLSFVQGSWQQTQLHQFIDGSDGRLPYSPVTLGSDGAVYGTTLEGGEGQCLYSEPCGTVFRVLP